MKVRKIIKWKREEVDRVIEILTEPCCSKMQEKLIGLTFETSKIYQVFEKMIPEYWDYCPFCGIEIERGLEKREEVE